MIAWFDVEKEVHALLSAAVGKKGSLCWSDRKSETASFNQPHFPRVKRSALGGTWNHRINVESRNRQSILFMQSGVCPRHHRRVMMEMSSNDHSEWVTGEEESMSWWGFSLILIFFFDRIIMANLLIMFLVGEFATFVSLHHPIRRLYLRFLEFCWIRINNGLIHQFFFWWECHNYMPIHGPHCFRWKWIPVSVEIVISLDSGMKTTWLLMTKGM